MTVVAVFGSSTLTPSDPVWAQAETVGRLLAEGGVVVANGGYGGAMEAVSCGAKKAGGRVIGVTAPPVFPQRQGVNPCVDEEIPARTIAERIHRLVDMADGWIALDGSIGTVTELMVAWNTAFVAPFRGVDPPPLVVLGESMARFVQAAASLVGADAGLVRISGRPEEAVRIVLEEIGRRRDPTG